MREKIPTVLPFVNVGGVERLTGKDVAVRGRKGLHEAQRANILP